MKLKDHANSKVREYQFIRTITKKVENLNNAIVLYYDSKIKDILRLFMNLSHAVGHCGSNGECWCVRNDGASAKQSGLLAQSDAWWWGMSVIFVGQKIHSSGLHGVLRVDRRCDRQTDRGMGWQRTCGILTEYDRWESKL